MFNTEQTVLALLGMGSLGILHATTRSPKLLGIAAGVCSLPWWLPTLVVRVRFWVFEAINGTEGQQFPSADVHDEAFKWLYNHKGASIRSRQNSIGITGLCEKL